MSSARSQISRNLGTFSAPKLRSFRRKMIIFRSGCLLKLIPSQKTPEMNERILSDDGPLGRHKARSAVPWMRFLCLLPVLLATCAFGQDSTSTEKKGVVQTLRETIHVATGEVPSEVPDPTDTLKAPGLDSLRAKRKLDSIRYIVEKTGTRIGSVRDSVNEIINLPREKINRAVAKVQAKVDTLVQRMNRPVGEANETIDETRESIQSRLDGTADKLEANVDRVENYVQQGVRKGTDGEMDLPGSALSPDVEAIALPDGSLALPGELPQVPGLEVNIPNVEIPGTENIKVPDVNFDVKNLAGKADIDLPAMDRVGDLTDDLQKIDGKLAEAEAYEEELGNIKTHGIGAAEKIPEEIESRVGQMEAFGELNKGGQKIEEYRNIVQGYRDPKLIKQELQRKARLIANDKLDALNPALKKAQQQFAKVKRLNPAVQSIKNLKKKRPNRMKDKPFRDRFVPGTTLQVYKADKVMFDWAVQAGYRISGRLTLGAGYTYRLSVDKTNTNGVGSEGLYGYRVYTQFGLFKNVFAHGEFEALTVDARKQPALVEVSSDKVHGSYFGLGRRYTISKKFRGSVTGLYRVNYRGKVPGLSRVQLRIGFDYDLSKRRNARSH